MDPLESPQPVAPVLESVSTAPPDQPPSQPDPDLDVVSDVRDDVRGKPKTGRDSKGRLVRGHRSFPSAGRPIEIAVKARKTLQNIKAFAVLGSIADGTQTAQPGQIEAIKLLMDRGYGKVVDVTTHLHLMAGASTEEKSGLSVLSADALTNLAKALMLPATTVAPAPANDVVEGELVPNE